MRVTLTGEEYQKLVDAKKAYESQLVEVYNKVHKESADIIKQAIANAANNTDRSTVTMYNPRDWMREIYRQIEVELSLLLDQKIPKS